MKKKIVIDLDRTLCCALADDDYSATSGKTSTPKVAYKDAIPNLPLIAQLTRYKADGYEIVIHTSRSIRTFSGNIGKINVHTLPTILQWLDKWNVPYDEVVVGKPWCGEDGFYVDDRAVRPNEFRDLDLKQLNELISAGQFDGT